MPKSRDWFDGYQAGYTKGWRMGFRKAKKLAMQVIRESKPITKPKATP